MPFLFLHSSIAGSDLCAVWNNKTYIGFTHLLILQGSFIIAHLGLKNKTDSDGFPNCQSYLISLFTILYLYLPASYIFKASFIQTPQIS